MTESFSKKFMPFVGMLLVLMIALSVVAGGDELNESNASRAVFEDPEFNFQFIRTIGYTATGGADINECLDTASA